MPSLFYSVRTLRTAIGETQVINVVWAPFVVPTWTKTVTIKAPLFNAQPVYITAEDPPVNPSAIAPLAGYPMYPGDVQVFPVKNLQNVRMVATAINQALAFLYIPDADIATKAAGG